MNILKMFSDMRNEINKAQKTLEERTVNRHENTMNSVDNVDAQIIDSQELSIEHEYKLTLLELGITE